MYEIQDDNEHVEGEKRMDELYDVEGFDTYYANDKDIIQESNGLGRIVFNGISLRGEKQKLDEKSYVDEYFKYTLGSATDIGTLIVTDRKTNESITITQYDPTLAQLGMVFDKEKIVEPIVKKDEEKRTQNKPSHYIQQDQQKEDYVNINLSHATSLTLRHLMHEIPDQILEQVKVILKAEDTIILKGKKELLIEEGDTFSDVVEYSKLPTPVLLERNSWLIDKGRVTFPKNSIVSTHKENLSLKDLIHYEKHFDKKLSDI